MTGDLKYILERLPDATMVVDRRGVITHANTLAEQMFGYGKELCGMTIEELVPEALREGHVRVRNQFTAHPRVRPMGIGTELTARRRHGAIFPVEISLSPLEVDGEPSVLSVVRDITERKQTESILKESEERYRGLVELSPEAIVVHKRGEILFANQAAARLFGVGSAADLTGRNMIEFVPQEYKAAVERRMDLPDDDPERQEPLRISARLDSGEEVFLEALGAMFRYRGQPATQVILRDVTRQKRSEAEILQSRERLRALSSYLQSAREEERAGIAREIHDELGQALTALKMDLAVLEERLSPEEAQRQIASMGALIDSTIQTMRRIATELRPVLLDSLGLVPALEWQAEEFQNRTGIVCRLKVDPEEIGIDKERSTALFRIFQETLTNVMRHARATVVEASLTQEEGALVLDVCDNGRGISPDEIANTRSFGLLGMRERALLFGGTVEISGKPGAGTSIRVRIPEEPRG